jgi:hypothetical protein
VALFEVDVTDETGLSDDPVGVWPPPADAVGLTDRFTYALSPLRIYVVNTEPGPNGGYQPAVPAGTPWTGNLYEKSGNVRKYLLITSHSLDGLPGVFGPITYDQIQAAIDADGGTLKGWTVDSVPIWITNGHQIDYQEIP